MNVIPRIFVVTGFMGSIVFVEQSVLIALLFRLRRSQRRTGFVTNVTLCSNPSNQLFYVSLPAVAPLHFAHSRRA